MTFPQVCSIPIIFRKIRKLFGAKKLGLSVDIWHVTSTLVFQPVLSFYWLKPWQKKRWLRHAQAFKLSSSVQSKPEKTTPRAFNSHEGSWISAGLRMAEMCWNVLERRLTVCRNCMELPSKIIQNSSRTRRQCLEIMAVWQSKCRRSDAVGRSFQESAEASTCSDAKHSTWTCTWLLGPGTR